MEIKRELPVEDQVRKAKAGSILFRGCSEDKRIAALRNIATHLNQASAKILAANARDIDEARKSHLSAAMIDRLTLDPARIIAMARSVEQIADQEQVVGSIVTQHTRPDGLKVAQERIPLGVISIIFESRPNVVVDCSALAIKSGNAVVLKGGKEAKYSNQVLGETIRHAIEPYIPSDIIQIIDSTDRNAIQRLLTMKDDINLIIPRGGESLINFVYEHSRIPIVAHFKGLCHTYIHADADLEKALKICLNAKVQRPGVCNAMETLLIHTAVPVPFITQLITTMQAAGVEIRGDHKLRKVSPSIVEATDIDWDTEYLDKILSVKIVADVAEAIAHIQQHGTHHSEAILAKDAGVIRKFCEAVDASCIMVNASTRFNDGGELGLGAELGISTSKIHAYGPMGAKEMTTLRFIVEGDGHARC